MYTISKHFEFSAAHMIEGLPDRHPCGRLHGHEYGVELILGSPEIDNVGFVRDFHDLSAFKQLLSERYDHRLLNDFLPLTSCEYLAKHFFEWAKRRWPELIAVKVSESPRSWAEYRERDT